MLDPIYLNNITKYIALVFIKKHSVDLLQSNIYLEKAFV